jgi:hypothetical protein
VRSQTVVPFAAVSFAYFAYAGLFGTYAPLWFQSLGYSTFAIGVLTALQSATRIFSPYAWGWLADHTQAARAVAQDRRRRLARCLDRLFRAAGYVWVAVVTLALFVATAGVLPISEALLAERVSSGGKVDIVRYGRVRVWGSFGFIAAVTASGFSPADCRCHSVSVACLGTARAAARRRVAPAGC